MGKNQQDNNSNFLEYIPVRNNEYRWEKDDKDNITIYVENKGMFNRIAQKLFKRPEVSRIHLQGIGNYVWQIIDGNMNVYELGVKVKEHYGDEAEPLYERLSKYMRMLEEYGFIVMLKDSEKSDQSI